MRTKILLFVFCVLFLASGAFAQMPTGQWYLIHAEVVKPSMVKEYEAASHAFVEMVLANRATMPHFNFLGFQGNDFVYTYVVPISNMAAVDSVNADFKAMMSGSAGAKFMEVLGQSSAAIEYSKEWIVGESPELSYTPVTPRLKPEEQKFFHNDIYYMKAEKGAEVEKLSKEFLELFKKKAVPDGYRIFMPVMGPEMPAVIVRIGAKDAADFYAATAKNEALLGDEFKALMDRAFALTRRFETRESWVRPDLTVTTPTK